MNENARKGTGPMRSGTALAAIFLFMSAPLIAFLLAIGLSWLVGCEAVDRVLPCVVAGADIAPMLNVAALAGWAMLATVPIGVCLLIVWAIVFARTSPRRVSGKKPS
ncbi:hypothetical protein [Oricola cellulosilytica]|uniref:Uncharacterized protein n=1 Tax=Oricola cellulosilytica TaxID=1429082 RepID=A0A4R0PDZ1_9HYPH|nr:hypothetical protein [Oricola cellulosilytica]TCD16006.1 hypothetical protein E0D97_00755 [Oricola cellulosilytica]